MSDALETVQFIEPELLKELLHDPARVTLIDVRSETEFAADHIDGAVNIPQNELAERAGEIPDGTMVVTVCNLGGSRSCGASEVLRGLGFENTMALRAGLKGWREKQS